MKLPCILFFILAACSQSNPNYEAEIYIHRYETFAMLSNGRCQLERACRDSADAAHDKYLKVKNSLAKNQLRGGK